MNETLNVINHKKGVKPYDLSIKPKKQRTHVTALAKIAVKILLKGKKYKINKVNMEELDNDMKKPFLLLCNHNQFTDFPIQLKSILPRKFINVASFDSFKGIYGLLHGIGGTIPKRKFTKDISLVRHIDYSLKTLKHVFGLYQEPQYSVDGLNDIKGNSIGRVIKMLKVPVVTLKMEGVYSNCPTWSDGKARNEVEMVATQTYAITEKDCETMTADEITARIKQLLDHDDWKYWQESSNTIVYPNRAVGIEKILYKCPECGKEYALKSSEANVKCNHCEQEWTLTEKGFLEGVNHETKFKSVSDWCLWERAEVKKELLSGKYIYEDVCEAYSMPHPKTFVSLGKINFKHTNEGFVFNGHYNKQNFKFAFEPTYSYMLQVELACPNFYKKDVVALSTLTDTIGLEPTNIGACYKLLLATEELYKIAVDKIQKR